VIAYVDTSALLRIVLREPGAVEDLRSYGGLVSNELIAVESARTIDRLRLQGSLNAEEAGARVRAVNEWLEAIATTDIAARPYFDLWHTSSPRPPDFSWKSGRPISGRLFQRGTVCPEQNRGPIFGIPRWSAGTELIESIGFAERHTVPRHTRHRGETIFRSVAYLVDRPN
jgi:hypothetical protein